MYFQESRVKSQPRVPGRVKAKHMPRPKGKPQYGWTYGGHMVDLRNLRGGLYRGKDRIKLVTAECWDDWYPVKPGEFKPRHTQQEIVFDE
jgi:hypothetical protein